MELFTPKKNIGSQARARLSLIEGDQGPWSNHSWAEFIPSNDVITVASGVYLATSAVPICLNQICFPKSNCKFLIFDSKDFFIDSTIYVFPQIVNDNENIPAPTSNNVRETTLSLYVVPSLKRSRRVVIVCLGVCVPNSWEETLTRGVWLLFTVEQSDVKLRSVSKQPTWVGAAPLQGIQWTWSSTMTRFLLLDQLLMLTKDLILVTLLSFW